MCSLHRASTGAPKVARWYSLDNGQMFKPPEGPELTPAQVLQLDDEFFGSRPFEYFSTRIASLISSAGSTEVDTLNGLGAEFSTVLGLTDTSDILSFSKSDRGLQLATDAFAVRHHAAEALVRMYHALTMATSSDGSPYCMWKAVAEGPTRTVDLVEQVMAHLASETARDSFWTLVLPPSVAANGEPSAEAVAALNVMAAWLQHAMNLLARGDININAAHNKVKHGLAVRSRDDVRVTFTTQPPNPDGTVTLSALTGPDAVDVFDTVTLDYLARPPKQDGRKQGLEISTLRLVPAVLLAETWMIAVTHAAMFHLAAARHFAGRDVQFAPYPRLPLGPSPEQLVGNSVVGMRQPLTTPPGGGDLDRDLGIAFQTAFVSLAVDFENKSTAVVVEG